MKHTQGEWIVDDGFQRQQEHIDALTDDLGNPDRHWVAVGIFDEDGFAESVAYCHPDNAPLISSAPNLLAALQACLGLLQDEYNRAVHTGHGTAASWAFINAKTAIAKATEAGL